MRAIQMADDSTPTYDMLHQAADYLIDDHQFDAAISLIQQSAGNSPQMPQVYQMLARCYEAMGQLDDADECFRQQDMAFPAFVGQHYLWAKRLGRHDANELRRKAVAYVRQPSDTVNLAPAVSVANDLDQKAMSLLRQSSSVDALDLAQLVVLSTKLNNKQNRAWAIGQIGAGYDVDRPFGLAFKALVEARNVEPAVAAFDAWAARQLDDELAVDWYSYAGRYLVAAGHAEQGRAYLIRAIHQRARERESYYFAWRELQKMGDDPKSLLAEAATRPSLGTVGK
jgi:tetratricopeptide (TPR) repeat protein